MAFQTWQVAKKQGVQWWPWNVLEPVMVSQSYDRPQDYEPEKNGHQNCYEGKKNQSFSGFHPWKKKNKQFKNFPNSSIPSITTPKKQKMIIIFNRCSPKFSSSFCWFVFFLSSFRSQSFQVSLLLAFWQRWPSPSLPKLLFHSLCAPLGECWLNLTTVEKKITH